MDQKSQIFIQSLFEDKRFRAYCMRLSSPQMRFLFRSLGMVESLPILYWFGGHVIDMPYGKRAKSMLAHLIQSENAFIRLQEGWSHQRISLPKWDKIWQALRNLLLFCAHQIGITVSVLSGIFGLTERHIRSIFNRIKMLCNEMELSDLNTLIHDLKHDLVLWGDDVHESWKSNRLIVSNKMIDDQ